MSQYKIEVEDEAVDALVADVLKDMYVNYDEDYDEDDEAKRAVLRTLRFFMTKAEYQNFCQQVVEGK